METARRAAGICGIFCAANSADNRAAQAGDFHGGPIAQNQFFATAGLIFGILSVTCFCCCCGCPFNILGLVFSLIGLSQISRQPELYEGRGFAIAGLILAAASLVLGFGLTLLNLALHPENFEWHFKSF